MRNQKGMTLLEVLAATVILSLAVIVFANVSGFSMFAQSKDDKSARALAFAQDQLAGVRDYVSKNNAFPPQMNYTLNGYQVTIQPPAALSSNLPAYNTTNFLPRHVSLQSIAYMNSAPTVITITVSWSE